jgi:uncharacterized protein with transglutaminase domain
MKLAEPTPGPSRPHGALVAALLLVPCIVLVLRLPVFPTAPWLNQALSLSSVPPKMQRHAEFVILVPLSAVVVSFFRLTLGLPVLSFFRPIVTAIGFRTIGIPWGLAFLIVVLGGVVAVKPLLHGERYYVRVPLLLSLTSIFLVVPMLVGTRWNLEVFRQVSWFPSICLALICDGFTRILNTQGLRAAMWPTVNMVLSAVVIDLLASIPGALHLLLGYPEVLVLQGGLILLIARYLDFELFVDRNPFMLRTAKPDAAPLPQPPAALRVAGE